LPYVSRQVSLIVTLHDNKIGGIVHIFMFLERRHEIAEMMLHTASDFDLG